MSQLALLIDDVITKLFPLDKAMLTIGRAQNSDICINDVSVSKSHAVIIVSPSSILEGHEDILIEDQQSRNGTFVNDRVIRRTQLYPNDVITIGWNKFKLLDNRSDSRETTVLMMLD